MDRVTESLAKARAWAEKPRPSARPYMIPDEVPSVRVTPFLGDAYSMVLKAPHWPFKPSVTIQTTREMKRRRHCLIRAVPEDGLWKAAEGSHRIWVASVLGVVVTIQPIDRNHLMQHDNPDLGIVTAGEIIDVGPEIRGPEALYRMEVA